MFYSRKRIALLYDDVNDDENVKIYYLWLCALSLKLAILVW